MPKKPIYPRSNKHHKIDFSNEQTSAKARETPVHREQIDHAASWPRRVKYYFFSLVLLATAMLIQCLLSVLSLPARFQGWQPATSEAFHTSGVFDCLVLEPR